MRCNTRHSVADGPGAPLAVDRDLNTLAAQGLLRGIDRDSYIAYPRAPQRRTNQDMR